jgi:hypothetical protein
MHPPTSRHAVSWLSARDWFVTVSFLGNRENGERTLVEMRLQLVTNASGNVEFRFLTAPMIVAFYV